MTSGKVSAMPQAARAATPSGLSEEWVPMPDYDGLYEVSDRGRVRSLYFDPPRVCRLGKDSNGYLTVALSGRGRRTTRTVHRLVCRAFHGEPYLIWNEAAHLSGDRADARASNLRWVTKVENHHHMRRHGTHPNGARNGRAKLSDADVATIRASKDHHPALAERFMVSVSAIERIKAGKTYRIAIADRVPEGVSGDFRIEHFTVTPEESERTRIRSWRDEYVPAGNYTRLMRDRIVVMSDTDFELRTNRPILSVATGDVLLNGLGIGMVLRHILKKPDVRSVTVVEKSAGVIALVAASFDDPRVTIVLADALEYQPPKGVRYNAVWHDIWDFVCSDNLPEMHKLHRKYARRCDWQWSWCRERCER